MLQFEKVTYKSALPGTNFKLSLAHILFKNGALVRTGTHLMTEWRLASTHNSTLCTETYAQSTCLAHGVLSNVLLIWQLRSSASEEALKRRSSYVPSAHLRRFGVHGGI